MRKHSLFGRTLALLLAVVMCLSSLPLSVFADETENAPVEERVVETTAAQVIETTEASAPEQTGETTETAEETESGNSYYVEEAMPAAYSYVTPKTWTKVALTDIQASDSIAITMTKDGTTWLLPNVGNGSKNQPLAGDTGAVEGQTLTTEGTDSLVWSITAVEGGYNIHAGDSYLYVTATNNGVRIGSTAGVWNVEGDYLASKDSKNETRYLGVYNAQDWRCYNNTTGNTAGQTLGFWKLDGAEEPKPPVVDPKPDTPADPTIVSIKDALAGEESTEFTVKGVVTLVDGQNIYLQDATGGICLRLKEKTTEIALGDTIIGTGKKTVYSGLTQLGNGTFEKSSGLPLTARETTIGALTTGDVCTYVKLTGLEVTEVFDKDGTYSAPNITVKDAEGKTIQLYKAVVGKTDGAWDVKVGDRLEVTAAVGVFNTTLQLRNTTADEIVIKNAEPAPTYDTIAAALAGEKDAQFTVKGVVTLVDGQNIYLQDATGGICLRLAEKTTEIALGDTIIGTGKKTVYSGLTQLGNGTFEKSSGLTLTARETTIGALTTGDVCTYVKLTGLEVTEVFDKDGTYSAPNITVKDAEGKTIQLYKAVVGKTDGAWDVKVGDRLEVTAAVGVFNTTLQLRNTTAGEIVVKTAEPEPEVGTITDGTYVIWDVNNKKALSATRTYEGSYYYSGVDVAETDGVLSGYGETEIWTVTVADGQLTITSGEEKLGMSGSYGSISNATGCTTWVLEDAGEGAYYIKNTETGKYIAYSTLYSSWSSGKDTASASVLKLTKASQTTGTETGKLADGDYVIWVTAHNMALSSNYSGYYNKGVAVSLDGTTLTGYGASEVWTLTNQEDGTITLSFGGKNLAMGANFTSTPLGEIHDRWVLEDTGDGQWYVKNVKRNAYLEWQKDKSTWSGYEFKTDENADLFKLTFTSAKELLVTDRTVEDTIAQWGGMVGAEDTAAVHGDRYTIGDQKDAGAEFTAAVGGKAIVPYTTGGTKDAPLYYMGGTGLGSGSGDYMQLAVNTAGWADMTLSFRLRVSGSGPDAFQLQYSTDGGKSFENFTTGSYSLSYTVYSQDGQTAKEESGTVSNGVAQAGKGYQNKKANYVSFSFDVPNEAANCENLLIRLIPGTASAKGGTVSSSGSTRMDNVVLTGSPMISNLIAGYVTAEPGCEEDQAVGTELTLTTETEGAAIFFRVNGGDWQSYSDSNRPVLASLPCNVEAYAKAEGKQNSVIRLFHYAAGTVGNVKMTPNGGSVWVPSADAPLEVKLSTTTEGAAVYYVIANADGTYPVDSEGKEAYQLYDPEKPITLKKGFGELTMKAYAVKDGFKDSAVNEKTFTERESESFNIYFGQLHSHTNISDGSGSITDAYAHGSQVKNLDFLAVTDHSNSFDNTDSGALGTDGTTISSEWAQAKAAAKEYTTDSFVGLYGFEMTWSNGLGHMNTFNTPGWQSRTQTDYKTYATALENYYTTLESVPESISQFNHPGTTFGDFSDFAHYTEARDELITLIEVGNGEGEIGSSGYFPSYEYYTRALDKGWHVAPTNNQDNHKGRWGDSNTARSVVLADSLSESAIYDAMRNYRVYATEDNDLNIYYTLDGNIMGTILTTSDVADTVELSVLLSDETDALAGATVQVIVNGGYALATKTIEAGKSRTISWQEELSFTVPSNYNYYYIKVTQADGDIAVTAPVWIGAVEAVGISSLTAESQLKVVGQEQTFNLELYNNEKKPLENVSVEFFQVMNKGESNETVTSLGKDTTITTVPKLGTAAASFTHTYTQDGMYTLRAVVKGTLNGMQKEYTQDLSFSVVPANITSTVIVDGTHYNDYVTGYYGGNVNNMVTLAADQNVQVKVVTDEITPEMLENCSLLIISAPARAAGTANAGDYVAKPFEDAFINMVADYVSGGGNLAVCGLADYQDKKAASADGHAAAQLNKLLKACGSTMRIQDDEVYDTENNGGQAYRLYPTNFNMNSKWTSGLVDGQQYSQYSGCSVSAGNGTWLVKGYETTCGVDSDRDGVGNTDETLVDGEYKYNIVTPKGEVVFLAAEDTKAGGTIFAAGGVFVSDFEVKAELDNIWDLPYANRTIYENILGITRTTPTISTIADVRKSTNGGTELGRIFVVEGNVTAGTANEHTKFFDAIYLQDETGGITVFPYSELGLKIGTRMRITGYTDAYQGDVEIQILNYEILSGDTKVYQPEKLSNKEAMDYETHGGELIRVQGTVEKVEMANGVVSQFILKDEKGDEAKVFVDGYILSGTTGKNTLADSIVKVGNTVSAVGLLYKHPEGSSDVSVPVLRVRDCDEVVLAGKQYQVTVEDNKDGTAEVDKKNPMAGEKVTITITPKEGKAVRRVYYKLNGRQYFVEPDVSGNYAFIQPQGDVSIVVEYANIYEVAVKVEGQTDYADVSVDKENPMSGETVTISVSCEDGFGVKDIHVKKDGKDIPVTRVNAPAARAAGKTVYYTFTQPEGDVDVHVQIARCYKVTIDSKSAKNGTITLDQEEYFEGDVVEITVKPNSGKKVSKVSAKETDGDQKRTVSKKNGKYTFTMKDFDVTVTVTFKNTNGTVSTGDTSHVYTYAAIMAVAAGALVILLINRKKFFKK